MLIAHGEDNDQRGFVERLVSISVSLFVDWLSLSNTESEVNPNNNLMMRQAGLSSSVRSN